MKQLTAVSIRGLDPDQEVVIDGDNISIVKTGSKPKRKGKGLKSLDLEPVEFQSITDVKWEPHVEVMPLSKVSMVKQSVMREMIDCSPNKSEVLGLISSSTLDNVMLAALAYEGFSSKPEVIGCALFNAWVGQAESQGALLTFVPKSDRQQQVGRMLSVRLLDEGSTLLYVDTVKRGMKINVSLGQPWAAEMVKDRGFIPVGLFK